MIKMENNITFIFDNEATDLHKGLNVSNEQFQHLKNKLAEIDQEIIDDITKDSSISLIKIVKTINDSGLSREQLVLAFSMVTFAELKAQYEQKDLFKEFEDIMASQEHINEEGETTYEELTEENDN